MGIKIKYLNRYICTQKKIKQYDGLYICCIIECIAFDIVLTEQSRQLA